MREAHGIIAFEIEIKSIEAMKNYLRTGMIKTMKTSLKNFIKQMTIKPLLSLKP